MEMVKKSYAGSFELIDFDGEDADGMRLIIDTASGRGLLVTLAELARFQREHDDRLRILTANPHSEDAVRFFWLHNAEHSFWLPRLEN